jgi:hypothetical protein
LVGYSSTGKEARVGGTYNDSSKAQWICPLTTTEMNGRFPFVFDWSNGKVLSKKACKMLKEDKVSAISEENLIILNPEWAESDADLMKTKMEARRARVKGGVISECRFYLVPSKEVRVHFLQ